MSSFLSGGPGAVPRTPGYSGPKTGLACVGIVQRGQDFAGADAEADAIAIALRVAAQRQRIAILKETAIVAGVECQRLLAAPAEFQQRAAFGFGGAGDRAGPEQVA